jgi:tetratricopeptide (TPR) repeat protein
MIRSVILLATTILFSALALDAQSLDRGRLLYTNKLYDEAKKALVAVAVSDAPPEQRAEALNLLGAIAIDEGNYETAIANWTELVTKYPGTKAALEAEAKLPLARKLAETPPPPTSPTVTVQTPPLKDEVLEESVVLVAGSAPEAPEFVDQAVLEFMNLLASKGVKAQDAFTGRLAAPGMSRVEAFSLPNLLSHARKVGAASVLYVFIHFHGMENMRVECYAADGRKLWSEKVAASLGLSPSGMTAGFIRRMSPKIAAHVGKEGLPITSSGG